MTIPHDNHIFWPWLTPVLQVSFWVLGAVPTFAGALGTCTGRSEGRAVAHFRSRGAKKGGWESLEDWPNTTTLKRNMEGLVYYIYKYILYVFYLSLFVACTQHSLFYMMWWVQCDRLRSMRKYQCTFSIRLVCMWLYDMVCIVFTFFWHTHVRFDIIQQHIMITYDTYILIW